MISNVISIEDMLKSYGEEATVALLSSFSCVRDGVQKNEEVENFVRKSAIDFYRRKLAVTFLVFDENSDFVGIYTLAHKAIDIPADRLNAKLKNKVRRYARLDEERQTYSVSAFLIAQFGKNYGVDGGNRISGSELMRFCNKELFELQHRLGGGLVYLDCEAHAGLIDFYEKKQNFRLFGERISDNERKRYLQYMKFL